MIQEVSTFWQKARIPSRSTDHCFDRLLKFYVEWKGLQKKLARTADKVKEKKYFLKILADFFDITHSGALGQMKND